MNPVTRNLTEKFKDARTIAQSRRLDLGESKIESSKVAPSTEYVDKFKTLDDILNKINNEINNGRKIYKNLIDDIFGKTNSGELLEIKIGEINIYFDDVRKRFEDIKKSIMSYHDPRQTIVKNMFIQGTEKFKKIIAKFQQLKTDYVTHLKSQTKIEKMPMSFSETSTYEDETILQSEQMRHDSELLEQRNKEISELCKSIVELSSIFRDLSLMVTDQGKIIDKIDKTMDNTVEITKKGVGEIMDARDKQKKCCIM
jgi:syntaxin 16